MARMPCARVTMVLSGIFCLLAIIVFIGGFGARHPKPEKREAPNILLLAFGLANGIITILLGFERFMRKGLLHGFVFLCVITMVFAGAVMYISGSIVNDLFFAEVNECQIDVENTCAQNGAMFAGAFIYCIAQLVAVNVVMLYAKNMDFANV
eukprot:TRINITY_DN336_c0_g1_i1.p1 TRINITY_DN336_c0_g1~~TRINITY_DN336_c0_g1_i1.p1  ORF type:complete len:152 (-),score=6.05 TRINITY_DN336_c0_g1_i1:64-519(-)